MHFKYVPGEEWTGESVRRWVVQPGWEVDLCIYTPLNYSRLFRSVYVSHIFRIGLECFRIEGTPYFITVGTRCLKSWIRITQIHISKLKAHHSTKPIQNDPEYVSIKTTLQIKTGSIKQRVIFPLFYGPLRVSPKGDLSDEQEECHPSWGDRHFLTSTPIDNQRHHDQSLQESVIYDDCDFSIDFVGMHSNTFPVSNGLVLVFRRWIVQSRMGRRFEYLYH
ncbi:hypothetical protein CEXT_500451 [Caerostris extrusa]|uniref:Uncharacterized protein n=1 Tax=Caerostris extrusa TaxID=172846 RepID=A0AAV4QTB6_CAEEX|nr:hypothetical protein CEXT_500451 [Caerostris extrusa]